MFLPNINGPQFLALYAIVALAFIAWALWCRRRTQLPTPMITPDVDDYVCQSYALGGAKRALQTVLVKLRLHGIAEPSADPQFWILTSPGYGAATHDLNDLEQAVLGAIRSERPVTSLFSDRAVLKAIVETHELAAERGYLLRDAQVTRMRMAIAVPGLALLGVGLARIVSGLTYGRPTGLLILMVSLLAIATALLTALGVQRIPTVAADRVLAPVGGAAQPNLVLHSVLVLGVTSAALGGTLAESDLASVQQASATTVSGGSAGGGSSGGCGSGGGGGGCGGCGGG